MLGPRTLLSIILAMAAVSRHIGPVLGAEIAPVDNRHGSLFERAAKHEAAARAQSKAGHRAGAKKAKVVKTNKKTTKRRPTTTRRAASTVRKSSTLKKRKTTKKPTSTRKASSTPKVTSTRKSSTTRAMSSTASAAWGLPSAALQQSGPLFQPISTTSPSASLFSPMPSHPRSPINIANPSTLPVGTNKWYNQLVLSPAGTDPIFPLPYGLVYLNGTSLVSGQSTQWTGLGLIHTAPSQRQFGPNAGANPVQYYINPLTISAVFGAKEITPSNTRGALSSWSELTAVFSVTPGTSSQSRLTFPIARGSAFLTALYSNLTPTLRSGLAITSFSPSSTLVNGFSKLRVGYNDGSTWLVYSAPKVAGGPALKLVQAGQTDITSSQGSWTGVVQMVKMSETYKVGGAEDALYDSSVGVWVTGATITSGSIGSGVYGYDFVTDGPRAGAVKPLVFALPHHVASLTSPSPVSPTIRLSSRVNGYMTLYSGSSWSLKEDVSIVGQFGVQMANPTLSSQVKPTANDLAVLQQFAQAEVGIDFSAESNLPTYYFSGKKLAKQALQCLAISTYLGSSSTLASQCLSKAKASFLQFSTGKQAASPLVYDKSWKGIISSGGIRSGNEYDDFGNSYYNDGHFHYGYFIHAAAVLSSLDSSFASQVSNYVNSLIRTINNPSTADSFFPFARNFDWFVGHSWATGLQTALDGKNEESSSEDINFFYGVKAWATVTGQKSLAALADLELAVMRRSFGVYYLMTDSNTVHPSNFIRNRVPGIVFENKCDYTTFFSSAKVAIHMIQAIPSTPILPYWRDPAWVQADWTDSGPSGDPQISTLASKLDSGYATLLYTQYAVVQPRTIADGLKANGDKTVLDDGASLTWSLAFALSQLGKQ